MALEQSCSSQICTVTESVSVKSSLTGADLGGHAHAGLAAVRLERLHEGQEPLQVVDLELEVRHPGGTESIWETPSKERAAVTVSPVCHRRDLSPGMLQIAETELDH